MGTCRNGYPWIQRVHDIVKVFSSVYWIMHEHLISYRSVWPYWVLFNGRNPLYLGVIFVVFLVGKAMWVQLDIAKEFQNGFVSIEATLPLVYISSFLKSSLLILVFMPAMLQLPAVLSLSTKFVPTIMNILKRLADEGQRPAAPERQREMELQPKSTRNGSHSNVTSAGSSSITSSESGPEYSSPIAHWSVHL